MSKIQQIVLAGALAFASAIPAVEAAPMTKAPLAVEKTSDVSNVGCWRCRGWRRGYHHRGRYWGPRVWVAPRVVVVGPRRHWAWCGPRWNRHRCLVRY